MSKRPELLEATLGPPSAVILDWSGPFADRVMSRIHEYDDSWPKPRYANTVVCLDARRARTRIRMMQEQMKL